jgi:hypothetical protein
LLEVLRRKSHELRVKDAVLDDEYARPFPSQCRELVEADDQDKLVRSYEQYLHDTHRLADDLQHRKDLEPHTDTR